MKRNVWIRRAIAVGAMTLSTVVASVIPPTAAHAATVLRSILCGGSRFGYDWQSYPSGGYTGEGCDAGISWVNTPTSSYSDYNLGTTTGNSYTFYAWIPTIGAYSNVTMNYDIFACNRVVLPVVVNQATHAGWTLLGTMSGFRDCPITIEAWSGAVSSHQMGLDAVRTVKNN